MALRKGSLCALVVLIAGNNGWRIIPGQILDVDNAGMADFWDSEEDLPHRFPRDLRQLKPIVTSLSDAEVGTVFLVRVDDNRDNDTYTYIEDAEILKALLAVAA